MCIILRRQTEVTCIFRCIARLLHGTQRQSADQSLLWSSLHFFQQLLDFFRADFISHMDVISEIIDKRTQFFYLIFFWRLMGTI